MPELPDVTVYREALERHLVGHRLASLRIASPFVLRSFDPPIGILDGRNVAGVRRLGKRLVLDFGDDLFLVLHLMIAGRLRWRRPGEKPGVGGKIILATFTFDNGSLVFSEAGSKKRASITLVRGEDALRALDPGGVEPMDATLAAFRAALALESHTLKRALTDPRLFSGIGNSYSDEILHAARLSPMKLTRSLTDAESEQLYKAVRATLGCWTDILRAQTGSGFPEKVTAFREGMAVHGRFGKPCPVCEAPVQRIVHAENEANYCARCQTGGKLLADRSLSRLLKDDWPRSIDDL